MAGDRAGALAAYDDDSLLSRIEAGENPARISESLGVHKSAIYHRFADRKDYKLARKNGMAVRVESAEGKIEDATDAFTLAQARELFKAVAWRAEREFPEQWGRQPDVLIQQVGNAEGLIESINQAILDRVRTVASQQVENQSVSTDKEIITK